MRLFAAIARITLAVILASFVTATAALVVLEARTSPSFHALFDSLFTG